MFFFFFFNDTATTEIYTLSLHDALPICGIQGRLGELRLYSESGTHYRTAFATRFSKQAVQHLLLDRKSTRLNSSHANISYAVFCLKKKKHKTIFSRFLLCSLLRSFADTS